MSSAAWSDAPLVSALSKYIARGAARFHTPGHKAAACSPLAAIFGDALRWDLTELPETDSLFDADGPIREAERRAAEDFGVQATLFSAGGNSLCIQACFALIAQNARSAGRAPQVICARNVHRSAVNAMALLGLEPFWVWPRPFAGSALPGRILPADVEAAFVATPHAAGVFVTSPDYYGVLSDISGIAAVCRRFDAPLVVDNAHGSHLFYLEGGRLHPLRQGADASCDSAHKTLPVLTGGAFLQLNSPFFSYAAAKDAMALFGSTSPSYPVMLSLDAARAWGAKEGRPAFLRLAEQVAAVLDIAAHKGMGLPEEAALDPVRITLDAGAAGYTGEETARALRSAGIAPEMADGRHAVLLPSPFTPAEDWARLGRFLLGIRPRKPLPAANSELPHPETVLTLHETIAAAAETVDAAGSTGRIAAEAKCPCPPGVPVVMPGERITAQTAAIIKNCGVLRIKVIR